MLKGKSQDKKNIYEHTVLIMLTSCPDACGRKCVMTLRVIMSLKLDQIMGDCYG